VVSKPWFTAPKEMEKGKGGREERKTARRKKRRKESVEANETARYI
jgi:hypothetical protein